MNSIADEITSASGRTGRRPGASGTRGAIAASARRLFAERGYERTTLRAIAADARVDAALVLHYFGSKQRLFAEVVELPFDPETLPSVLAGDRDGLGDRFATFLLAVLENHEARARLVAIVRAAASEPTAADAVRELLSTRVIGAVAGALGEPDAVLRANLVGTQVVGLVMARYVVRVEPLASLAADEVAAAVAPTLQRYLAAPLR